MWNSEEEKNFDIDFNERLQRLRMMDDATIKQLMALLETAKNSLMPLLQKENRTAEEEAVLTKALAGISDIKQMIDDARLILNAGMLRQSVAVYENIKQLAAEGDAKAIKALKELEPLYKGHLREGLSEN